MKRFFKIFMVVLVFLYVVPIKGQQANEVKCGTVFTSQEIQEMNQTISTYAKSTTSIKIPIAVHVFCKYIL
ncbi:MAG: hypothetical protein R3E32_12430 [Chitinophagales bacterium]